MAGNRKLQQHPQNLQLINYPLNSSGSDFQFQIFTFEKLFRRIQLLGSTTDNISVRESIKRILVVDDEKDISLIFKSGLERRGFDVDVSNDPLEALEKYKSGYYDLLLLDIRMPKMSGFELWSEIKKKDQRCKVCFVSAFEIHEDEFKKYLPEETDSCIVKKPVSMKDLVSIINEKLKGS